MRSTCRAAISVVVSQCPNGTEALATLPARRPAEAPRHIRREARLVEENKRFRVEIELALEPFLSGLGDVLPVLYLREDEIGVRLDAPRAAVAPHIGPRRLAGGFDALGPAHGGRRTDIEPGGGLSARHPAADRLHRKRFQRFSNSET
jgi:hypothetical protein